jgi:thiamine-phosphate pyrophosphorylase
VTYSPIFTTPNKGEPKGIEDLKDVLEITEIKIFALGGIVEDEQIKSISQTDSFGFASIRYFY